MTGTQLKASDIMTRAVVCVRSGTSLRELEKIFQAKEGGPMEAGAALIATWLPTKRARIEVTDQNGDIYATVDGVGEIFSKWSEEKFVRERGEEASTKGILECPHPSRNRRVTEANSSGCARERPTSTHGRQHSQIVPVPRLHIRCALLHSNYAKTIIYEPL